MMLRSARRVRGGSGSRVRSLASAGGALAALAALAFAPACSSDEAASPVAVVPDAEVPETVDAEAPAVCDPYVARTSPVEALVGPTDVAPWLVSAIEGATKSIELMTSSAEQKAVLSALVAAKARGVAVRAVVDPANAASIESALGDAAKASSFPAAGANLMIVDGERALVASADVSAASLAGARSYAVVVRDADDLERLGALFEHDFAAGTGAPEQVCARLALFPGGRPLLMAHVEGAEDKLDVQVSTMSDPALLAAIEARASSGVPVRVLLSGSESIAPNAALGARLLAAGAEVRYFRALELRSRLVSTERGALVGSYELSTTSLDRDRELAIFVTDEASLEKLSEQFEADWLNAALE